MVTAQIAVEELLEKIKKLTVWKTEIFKHGKNKNGGSKVEFGIIKPAHMQQ